MSELARDFPLLATLTDPRPGGQRKLALGGAGTAASDSATALIASAGDRESAVEQAAPGEEPPVVSEALPHAPTPPLEPEARGAISAGGRKRRAHLSLRIDFAHRPDDPSLGRLVESTLWVNEAHPAYRRALASRSQGYHLALTVAMTLAPLAVEPGEVHGFVTTFLERWGAAAKGG